MDHSKVHSFFSHVSRITIILPLVILAVGIVLKADQQKMLSKTQQLQQATLAPILTPTPSPQAKKKSTPVNLTGPLTCLVTTKNAGEAQGTVHIKNRSVYVQFVKTNPQADESFYLVKGECLYRWKKGIPTGEKTCGLQQYLTIMDTLSGLNLLDAETMINMFVEQGGDRTLAEKFEAPVCQKAEIQDSTFTIPAGVRFTEKVVLSPTKASAQ